MKDNPIKTTLSKGGTAVGTMVFEFTVPGLARLAGAGGVDFVLFDMEHTGLSMERLGMLAAVAAGADVVPLVRVPATDYQLMSRPLELGVMGLMIPSVESAEQAAAVVASTRYPPGGRRGTAFGIAHDGYAPGDPVAMMKHANDNLLIIAQIETVAGMSQVHEIAAVDGIDVLWIGHNDLTTSMGIPGQLEHPDYLDALGRVISACTEHGKAGGFCPGSVDQARDLVSRGFRCLAYRNDVAIYRDGLRHGVDVIRKAARAQEVGRGDLSDD